MNPETADLMFSSASVEWATPQSFYDYINTYFDPFDLDPAATDENHKAPAYYTKEQDGLRQPWFGKVFINPPYQEPERACRSVCLKKRCIKRGWHTDVDLPGMDDWVRKTIHEVQTNPKVEKAVMLLPARTDTKWYHELVLENAHTIYFIKGRLNFNEAGSGAPFPSILVTFHKTRYDRPEFSTMVKR